MSDAAATWLPPDHFQARGEAEAERAWHALQQRVPVGQPVTGKVVAKSPFGAWIDLGVGFRALLEIPNVAGLTPERYRAGDWCPVGSEVSAVVLMYRDRGRQIYLGQVECRRRLTGASTA